MTRRDLVAFLRRHKLAVQASLHETPGVAYVRVRPTRIRYRDFTKPEIVELRAEDLA
jgi:hypothetical protein